MQLQFTNTSVDRIDCDLLILGCCEEERPLRGAAGLTDWRLHGLLSKTILKHRFAATCDEKLLLPGGHRLGCKRILLIGLGNQLQVDVTRVQAFGKAAVVNALSLQAKSCAVYYPDILVQAAFNRNSLKWLLEGISAGVATTKDTDVLADFSLYIPSLCNEEVDFTRIMLPKLLARHTPTADDLLTA